MASRRTLLCLLLGVLLVTAPLLRAEEDEYDEEADEEAEEAEEEYADGLDDGEDAEPAGDSHVLKLTTSTFNSTVAKHEFALVAFISPDCSSCQELLPQFESAAALLAASEAARALLATVDVTVETRLAADFVIEEFPMLKWFINGTFAADYTGSDSHSENIVNWVERKAGPPLVRIDSTAELDAKLVHETTVVAFWPSAGAPPEERATFQEVAKASLYSIFLETSDEGVAARLGLDTSAPGYAIARQHPVLGFQAVTAAGNEHFAGTSLQAQLEAFISAERLPLYVHLTPTTASDVFASGLSHIIIIVAPAAQLKADSPLIAKVLTAAAQVRGRALFSTCDRGGDFAERMEEFYSVKAPKDRPLVLGLDIVAGAKKSIMPQGEEVTADGLAKFAESVVGKAAKPDKTPPKSEPKPSPPTENGVTVVVSSTVESIAMDPTKDVFLMVYSPKECDLCKGMLPILEDLAKHFEGQADHVVIAKMDGAAHHHTAVDHHASNHIPTFHFFPAKEGAPAVPYQGLPILRSMTRFINDNAKSHIADKNSHDEL